MKRIRLRLPLAALLVVGLLPAAMAAGKTYRWVDAQGRVHYGDVPAPLSEEIIVKPASGTGVAAAPKSDDKKNAAECQRRKEQLAAYKSATTVNETDAQGNIREYTAAEKEKLITRTEAQMREACGGP